MSYGAPGFQAVAGGNIAPSRIVKVSTAADNTWLQSTSNTDANEGVSAIGTRRAPGTGDDDGFDAIAPEGIMVFGVGSICTVEAGAAFTAGALLTADTNGRAIATTTTGDSVIGRALQAASQLGDLPLIVVRPFVL